MQGGSTYNTTNDDEQDTFVLLRFETVTPHYSSFTLCSRMIRKFRQFIMMHLCRIKGYALLRHIGLGVDSVVMCITAAIIKKLAYLRFSGSIIATSSSYYLSSTVISKCSF